MNELNELVVLFSLRPVKHCPQAPSSINTLLRFKYDKVVSWG